MPASVMADYTAVADNSAKPRRPPSHAKRHFSKRNSRWGCNYCDMSYGSKTATSNFWKHLTSKHPHRLNADDERQSSVVHSSRNARHKQRSRCHSPPNGHVTLIEQALDSEGSLKVNINRPLIQYTNAEPNGTVSSDMLATLTSWGTAVGRDQATAEARTPVVEHQQKFREIGMEQIAFDVIRSNPRFAELFHDGQIQALFRRATPSFAVQNIDQIEREILRIQQDKMAEALSQYGGGYYLYIEPVSVLDGRKHLAVLLAHEKFDYFEQHPDILQTEALADCGEAETYEMESLFRYKRNKCHVLALLELDAVAGGARSDAAEEVAVCLEQFKVSNKLLGIVVGRFQREGDFVKLLHHRLSRHGLHPCERYATGESIASELQLNLEQFRQHAVLIKEQLLKCIHYLNQIEKSQQMMTCDYQIATELVKLFDEATTSHELGSCELTDNAFFADRQLALTEGGVDDLPTFGLATYGMGPFTCDAATTKTATATTCLPEVALVLDAFCKLSWDLMPILPHAGHIKRYLTEGRALGLGYNYNCGTHWEELKLTLDELSRHLGTLLLITSGPAVIGRRAMDFEVGGESRGCSEVFYRQAELRQRDYDGGAAESLVAGGRIKLLQKLQRKINVFPSFCEAALDFLTSAKLTSPFTRKLIKTAEKLPKGLSEQTRKNILFLKMWTKFNFDER